MSGDIETDFVVYKQSKRQQTGSGSGTPVGHMLEGANGALRPTPVDDVAGMADDIATIAICRR